MNAIAHGLDLKVIPVGVEGDEQAKVLALFKSNELQGYLVSRPLPADQLLEDMRNRC